jgi:HK97 family phage portal protein
MSLNSQQQFSFVDWMNEGGQANIRNNVLSTSYERVSWVYACINTIGTVASSAPLAFYTDPTCSERFRLKDEKHNVVTLFNPPKPPFIPSLRELIFRTFVHLGIQGRVFWVFEKKNGKYAEIDLKGNLRSVLTNGSYGKLMYWEEHNAMGSFKWQPEQVLPVVYYNPRDLVTTDVPVTGLSPLMAARQSLDQEFNINGWNTSFFKTGMKTPLLLKAKGTLSKEQKADLRKEIVNYYSGIDGAHGALIVSGGIEVTPLSISQKDIDFIEGKKFNREEIASIYGVPPALLGLFEFSNYSNAREQRKIFWENTLLPKMAMILDLVQINILDRYFPGIYAKWDTSNIYGLKPDASDVANAAKVYYEMGIGVKDLATLLRLPELANIKLEDRTPKLPNILNRPTPGGNNNKPIPQANRRPKPGKPIDNPGDPSNVQNAPKKDLEKFFTNVLSRYTNSAIMTKQRSPKLNKKSWSMEFISIVQPELEKFCEINNYSISIALDKCNCFVTFLLDGKISLQSVQNEPSKFAGVLVSSIVNKL